MSKPFTSPTGRLVFGDVFKAALLTEDDNKTPKIDKTTGQQMIEYVIGVAFDKRDPAWQQFKALLKTEDSTAYPQFHDGLVLKPGIRFADKIYDGDGYNTKGQHNAKKDGWAGHEIVKFSTQYAPNAFEWANNSWAQITDPNRIKRGYYVRVSGTTQANNSSQTPGMYRNFNMVALVAFGAEIQTGPDANEAFGGAPTLPPGASAVPVNTAPMPVAAPAPVAAATPTPATAPTAATPAAAPYSAYHAAPTATPPAVAPAPVAAPPAAPAPGRVMLPPANGASYEQMIAAGWTDALLVQHGMMQA